MKSTLNSWRWAFARARRDEAASILIEFALTLPLLLLILMGVIDFGMAFQEKLLAINAAREGARMAVLPGYEDGDVLARIDAYFTANGRSGYRRHIDPPITLTPAVGDPFTVRSVTVEYDHTFSFIAPIAYMFGGSFGTITLTGTSVMRTEIPAAP